MNYSPEELDAGLHDAGAALRAVPSMAPSVMGRLVMRPRRPRRMLLPAIGAAACFILIAALTMKGVHAQFLSDAPPANTSAVVYSPLVLLLLAGILAEIFIFIPWCLLGLTSKARYPVAWYALVLCAFLPGIWQRINLPAAMPVSAHIGAASADGLLRIDGLRFVPPVDGLARVELRVRNDAASPRCLAVEGFVHGGRIGAFYHPGSCIMNHVAMIPPNWEGTVEYSGAVPFTLGHGSRASFTLWLFPQAQQGTMPIPEDAERLYETTLPLN